MWRVIIVYQCKFKKYNQNKLKKIISLLIIFFSLAFFYPIRTYSAEILQINNSSSILVGDQNRDLPIKLFCVDINDVEDEEIAINLLKREFPRGSRVKIKPMGFRDNILVARVFNISETKEMSELLITKDLTKETCQN